ncbi:hypothetical protein BIFDEN_01936 [Bifidobacterium dentium ATCC 27678]|nr:hypothetical protein BIFDEN_01936 [Bifidobacterium dentium ATCC 27678]
MQGFANACSDIEDGESSSSSSGYTVPEYKGMPDLRTRPVSSRILSQSMSHGMKLLPGYGRQG